MDSNKLAETATLEEIPLETAGNAALAAAPDAEMIEEITRE
jgi:hypothetical protein